MAIYGNIKIPNTGNIFQNNWYYKIVISYIGNKLDYQQVI